MCLGAVRSGAFSVLDSFVTNPALLCPVQCGAGPGPGCPPVPACPSPRAGQEPVSHGKGWCAARGSRPAGPSDAGGGGPGRGGRERKETASHGSAGKPLRSRRPTRNMTCGGDSGRSPLAEVLPRSSCITASQQRASDLSASEIRFA